MRIFTDIPGQKTPRTFPGQKTQRLKAKEKKTFSHRLSQKSQRKKAKRQEKKKKLDTDIRR